MSNPKDPEGHQAKIDKNPFEGFLIDDDSVLDCLEGRHPCPSCGKSRKFFCYTCYVPIAELQGRLPVVKLPIKIDIIKHKHEIDGKSTAGHAAILAPDDVSIYTYPDIPDYNNENVVLIFPSQNALNLSEVLEADSYECIKKSSHFKRSRDIPKGFNPSTLMKKSEKTNPVISGAVKSIPITRAIFIDSTWNQSKGIYKDERIKNIPCVVIQNRISQFWRHQKGSPRWYLATIEAIHQFLVELHLNMWGLSATYTGISKCFSEKILETDEKLFTNNPNSYNGQYDNLLYFFKHMYHLIHLYYNHDNLYAYKRRLE